MKSMDQKTLEQIYAGWLGKLIGIRLGAPIEGWTYETINRVYGKIDGYLVDYRDFAADDDSNGPVFFIRALEDCGNIERFSSQDVAEALLNYAPYEHGFFWWGGYGISTEHTAYLNLRNGVPAPESGSILMNGSTVAEQIGGQIFIDVWGLVAPANPELAARYAKEAASVTHDRNGIYGGIYVAVCISLAFEERNINRLLETALQYIPVDCEYSKAVRAVMDFHRLHQEDWRDCYAYIRDNWGYEKYPGNCHIIPNASVMILSMLYGEGNFSKTLNICNMCGWDTDCNVGNVGVIMGVLCGLDEISSFWREPINDLLLCSGVVGSLNILDAPQVALYTAKLACQCGWMKLPNCWDELSKMPTDYCHFEFPGSTHAMRIKRRNKSIRGLEYRLQNSCETANTGARSLKITIAQIQPGDEFCVYKKTYYKPDDLHDSRYDPEFTPLVYPGQTLHGSTYIPSDSQCAVRLYAKESRSGEYILGESVVARGEWISLQMKIPSRSGALIDEIGFLLTAMAEAAKLVTITAFIDDMYTDGGPDYTIDLSKEETEWWTTTHIDISQFTRLKGLAYLADGQLHLSCSDLGEVYTGHHEWLNYTVDYNIMPYYGKVHAVCFRVQGASRSYMAGFYNNDCMALVKKSFNSEKTLCNAKFDWQNNKEYHFSILVQDNHITISVDGNQLIDFYDEDMPYLKGAIGLAVRDGSHLSCRSIHVLSRE